MKFFLCRHGQTEANATRMMAGHIDTPLTLLGLSQIRQVATTIGEFITEKDIVIDLVASSDLGRAFRTATLLTEHIRQHHESWRILDNYHNVHVDARLREMDYGKNNWRPIPEVNALPGYYDTNFTHPDGESFRTMQARAVNYIQEYAMRSPRNDNYKLIVAHSGVIRAINDHWGQYNIAHGKERTVPHTYIGMYELDTDAKLVNYGELFVKPLGSDIAVKV